jgi:hypothetical protein
MNSELKIELLYIASDKGFHGVTVRFLNESYSVTVLGLNSDDRLVEIAVNDWIDND